MGSVSQVGLVFYSLILIIMANMSYCRFQNTYSDLADCVRWMQDHSDVVFAIQDSRRISDIKACDGSEDDLSDDEAQAMIDLIEMCEDIVRDFSTDYELEAIDYGSDDSE